MKKNDIMFLVYMILLISIISGCSSKIDSFPPYLYPLKIEFVDKAGNDKVQGINYINNDKAEENTYEIELSKYKLEVTQTGKSKEKLFLTPLSVQKADSYDCLVFTTSTLASPDYRPAKLTHKLICSYIFGDNDEHTIISNWEETSPVGTLCTSIIVDGRTFSATGIDKQGYSIALVVLE